MVPQRAAGGGAGRSRGSRLWRASSVAALLEMNASASARGEGEPRLDPPGCWLYTGWTSEYAAAVSAWKAIEQAEPEFAGRVRRLFDAGRHKTIATLRADGSPRVSGIECEFTDGDLRFGSMTGARKGADLKRDPRFALHGPAFHPEEGKERDWPGEAKIAGRAIPAVPVATDEASEQPDGQMFVADITEVVITGLNAEATKLVVESWTPEQGLRRVERD
jgi:Pyridoxamine 5'-phosphate oxidase